MFQTAPATTGQPGDPEVAALLAELATPAGVADPYSVYARLRERGPALAGPGDALVVTGYRQCSALLRENRLSKDPGRLLAASGFPDWRQRPALGLMFESMLMLNPPRHTAVRGQVARAFTARRVAALRAKMEAIADRLLDALPDEVDFVEAVGFPFPVTVTGELLGVPAEDRLRFRGLVEEWTAVLEILEPAAVARADAAAADIVAYFQALAARRREDPRDDLISGLVHAGDAEPATPALADEDVVRTAALILAAGFETTSGLLANGLVALLAHPDQAQRLRREPELAKPAVDELLRYDSPVQMLYGRTAVDDLVVGGVSLHAGQRVISVLGAANRDPSVFTAPDRLILDRDEGLPLSFGAGIHHCLGAALARLEGQVMLPRLLRRFPELRLAGPGERRPGATTLRGYRSLPMALR